MGIVEVGAVAGVAQAQLGRRWGQKRRDPTHPGRREQGPVAQRR